MKITKDTVFDVLHMLDAAVDLLDDDSVGQMRRRAILCPLFATLQRQCYAVVVHPVQTQASADCCPVHRSDGTLADLPHGVS